MDSKEAVKVLTESKVSFIYRRARGFLQGTPDGQDILQYENRTLLESAHIAMLSRLITSLFLGHSSHCITILRHLISLKHIRELAPAALKRTEQPLLDLFATTFERTPAWRDYRCHLTSWGSLNLAFLTMSRDFHLNGCATSGAILRSREAGGTDMIRNPVVSWLLEEDANPTRLEMNTDRTHFQTPFVNFLLYVRSWLRVDLPSHEVMRLLGAICEFQGPCANVKSQFVLTFHSAYLEYGNHGYLRLGSLLERNLRGESLIYGLRINIVVLVELSIPHISCNCSDESQERKTRLEKLINIEDAAPAKTVLLEVVYRFDLVDQVFALPIVQDEKSDRLLARTDLDYPQRGMATVQPVMLPKTVTSPPETWEHDRYLYRLERRQLIEEQVLCTHLSREMNATGIGKWLVQREYLPKEVVNQSVLVDSVPKEVHPSFAYNLYPITIVSCIGIILADSHDKEQSLDLVYLI
ncbi:hypothetical protein K469DRAFT_687401 [Zopfia rhizophila CBS 207.26]|uniref:Uncharacterized protein n=1 Tax=Zopfia rhizophila CBS 207.26 TaxID=1314779 RepID=A0A6A6E209_9PEZI|nr:hypothetical protein K469DRAFT_687401 [Zopfia rhizophila CBS 207.26]